MNRLRRFDFCNKIFEVSNLNYSFNSKRYKSYDQSSSDANKYKNEFATSQRKAMATNKNVSMQNKSMRIFETDQDADLSKDQSPKEANKQRDEFNRSHGNIETNQRVSNTHDLIDSPEKQKPVDWLSKLSQNSSTEFVNNDQTYRHIKKYTNLSVEEKTDLINKEMATLPEKLPQNIIDKHWEDLLKLKSYRKMTNTLKY